MSPKAGAVPAQRATGREEHGRGKIRTKRGQRAKKWSSKDGKTRAKLGQAPGIGASSSTQSPRGSSRCLRWGGAWRKSLEEGKRGRRRKGMPLGKAKDGPGKAEQGMGGPPVGGGATKRHGVAFSRQEGGAGFVGGGSFKHPIPSGSANNNFLPFEQGNCRPIPENWDFFVCTWCQKGLDRRLTRVSGSGSLRTHSKSSPPSPSSPLPPTPPDSLAKKARRPLPWKVAAVWVFRGSRESITSLDARKQKSQYPRPDASR